MVAIGMVQAVGATNKTPVSYDYTGRADPANPDYAVSIPTGLVFDAKNVDNAIDLSVKLVPAQGETNITANCKAEVKVKSANGYKVSLAGGVDEISYKVLYEGVELSGTTDTVIGTLQKNTTAPADDKLKIEGSAKLLGVATRTGNHTDTLTYTITNIQ